MGTYVAYNAKNFRAIKDHIIVTEMQFTGRTLESGIVLPSDDRKSEGIRPRWGKVIAIGPDVDEVKVGQYVLVSHGRWTRALTVNWDGYDDPIDIQRVDNNEILLVSDKPQLDETMSIEQGGDQMQADARMYGSMHNSDTGYADI